MNKDLFDLLKELESKSNELNQVFETTYLDSIIDIVWYLILDSYHIKQDNEKAQTILVRFGCGEISKQAAMKGLSKHSQF